MMSCFMSSEQDTEPSDLHGSPFDATDVSHDTDWPSSEHPPRPRHSRIFSKWRFFHGSARFFSGEHANSSSPLAMHGAPSSAIESSQLARSGILTQPSGPLHGTCTNTPS